MKYLLSIILLTGLAFGQLGGGQLGQGTATNNINATTAGASNSVELLYQVSALQTPATPVVTYSGTAGAGTWDYKIVIFDSYGNMASVPSANGACSSAATTLDGTHTCSVPCPASWGTFDGTAPTCNVYRTVSAGTPANLSLVCTGTALGANCVDNGSVNTASVTPGVIVGTGAAVAFGTYTVKAKQILAGKCLRISADWSHSTGTASVAYTLNYAASGSSVASAATGLLNTIGYVCDEPGLTGAQSVSFPIVGVSAPTEIAIDSTASQSLTFKFNVAATDQLTPKLFRVELVQ